MKWLKRLLGLSTKKEGYGRDRSAGEGRFVLLDDDATYQENSDVLEGLEFVATLQVRTPLKVLEHHGEVFRGPPSKAPRYASQADGIWVPKTKSWTALGIDAEELPEGEHASDIGLVEPSEYLPFLKEFRRVVESPVDHQTKVKNLEALRKTSMLYDEIWQHLESTYEDFPHSFFYLELTQLPGVGKKTARGLYYAGFHSIEAVLSASRAQLLNVPGIGATLADRIIGYAKPREGQKSEP